jgi:hypothetical protein
MKSKKTNKTPEPHWQSLVSTYFSFCAEKYHDVPTFDGSAPRDLKSIIVALRKRCESAGEEWTFEAATGRFKHFLEYAYANDAWLRENWILSNINRHKDKFFFNKSKHASKG